MSPLIPLPPVSAIGPIREIDGALESLLSGLGDDEWRLPAVKDWRVRDVGAHLLDTNLRRLSLDRDRHRPDGTPPPEGPESFGSWVEFLNRLNADWTRAAERLSPAVILQLIQLTNPQVTDYFESLDPDAPATFGVAWAGASESKVWLDVAREYTEKWHHQQQIRDAVGQPGLDAPHLLRPLIETLLRAVPRAYAAMSAKQGSAVLVEATDLAGARWVVRRDGPDWNLYEAEETSGDAAIRMPSGDLWRLLMNQIPRDDARARAKTSGAAELIAPLFDAVAVMA